MLDPYDLHQTYDGDDITDADDPAYWRDRVTVSIPARGYVEDEPSYGDLSEYLRNEAST